MNKNDGRKSLNRVVTDIIRFLEMNMNGKFQGNLRYLLLLPNP